MALFKRYADVAVIGGGPAGLTAAWLLLRRGVDVVVIEKEEEVGGNVRSSRKDGYLIERGPYCFLKSSRSVWRLLREMGMDGEAVGGSNLQWRKFIFRDGLLHPLPLGPLSFISSRLFTTQGKLRILAEPLTPGCAREDDSAWEFFRRRFGKEFADYVASSFVSGIYAGDAHLLGAKAAFPKFWEFEHQTGSMIRGALGYIRRMRKEDRKEGIHKRKGVWTFKEGLGTLTRRLAAHLNGRILQGFRVTKVGRSAQGFMIEGVTKDGDVGEGFRCRRLIVATPPDEASQLLAGSFPEVATILGEVPMVAVAVVQWAPEVTAKDPFPDGFGFLVPPLYNMKTLGTIFYSHIFPHMGRDGGPRLYGTYLGGAHHGEAVYLSNDEMLEQIRADHRVLLGKEVPEPSFFNVVRHPRAIAQLLPDHPEKVKRAEGLLRKDGGVVLAGGYLAGVGIDHAVESAYRATAVILGEGERWP